MGKKRGFIGYLIGLLMPLILVLGGAGLAALGVVKGSLVRIVMGETVGTSVMNHLPRTGTGR